jgi:hypothetical protein
MPQPGFFVLHSRAVPPLPAGDYTLTGNQSVTGGATEPYEGHLRVNSPRYKMPPDQILSTFPPANAEGAFETRLPQIVLKRRTLPWERAVDPAHREIPWLALVVIAEGEGQISGDTPVKDCASAGVTLNGPNDVATGVYLSVSQTVVDKVFPTKDDLQLLVHVREVDLNDTELALGDDDGFLAIVMANRLPQYDRVNCKPVRYMACLVNLEGQLDVLPNPPDFSLNFDFVSAVQDVRALAPSVSYGADQYVMGTGVKAATKAGIANNIRAVTPPGALRALPASSQADFSTRATTPPVSRAAPVSQSWSASQTKVSNIAASAAPSDAGRLVRDEMTAGFRSPVELIVLEKTYRFPVLSYWSFTSTGAGSFETLMQGLDVGLLGTLPADPAARPKPDCAPPAKGDAPPPTDPPRPAPEVTDTGHVGLHHGTRRGDSLRAWYRGPFTLHVTERSQPEADGHLTLANTSDQLRRITPDGREDLSLAAGFEIGRLLALSQPSAVSALMRWRREQFGADRARQLGSMAVAKLTALKVAITGSIADLGQLVGKQIVLQTAKDPAKVLAPDRPLVDPGRPLTYLAKGVDQVIADGFGFSLDAVRKNASTVGVAGALSQVAVPRAAAARFDERAAAHLKAGLASAVESLATNVVTKTPSLVGGLAAGLRADRKAHPAQRDALDDLLDAAAIRNAKE